MVKYDSKSRDKEASLWSNVLCSKKDDTDEWHESITGVKFEDLTKDQISRIITSSMFLKEKFTEDDLFEKLKARLVAGGHLHDREIYDKGTSPTVSASSVFLVAALAASNNRAPACIDFPGAFLYVDMPEVGKHVVLMRINKFLTSVLIRIDPHGPCVVRLKKALYGCVESAVIKNRILYSV